MGSTPSKDSKGDAGFSSSDLSPFFSFGEDCHIVVVVFMLFNILFSCLLFLWLVM